MSVPLGTKLGVLDLATVVQAQSRLGILPEFIGLSPGLVVLGFRLRLRGLKILRGVLEISLLRGAFPRHLGKTDQTGENSRAGAQAKLKGKFRGRNPGRAM